MSMGANAGLQLLAVVEGTRDFASELDCQPGASFQGQPDCPAAAGVPLRFRDEVPPQEGDVEQSSRMSVAVDSEGVRPALTKRGLLFSSAVVINRYFQQCQ